MRAAYDALPDATKNRIKGMKTAYMMTSSVRADVTNIDVLKDQAAVQKGSMIQPLVQTHPERSTRSIWFHAGKTENILGMESTGTRSFLAELPEEPIKPELSYVHEYIVGGMLTVDNRSRCIRPPSIATTANTACSTVHSFMAHGSSKASV